LVIRDFEFIGSGFLITGFLDVWILLDFQDLDDRFFQERMFGCFQDLDNVGSGFLSGFSGSGLFRMLDLVGFSGFGFFGIWIVAF
jgi:hypothetical protein